MTAAWPYELKLYLLTIGLAFGVSVVVTPLIRLFGVRYHFLDRAHAGIKTHKVPVPSLGGFAVFAGLLTSLLYIRFTTDFPTGTLYNLRAVLLGSAIVFVVGFIDDLKKPEGLTWKSKLGAQVLAACVLVYNGISIDFIKPAHLAHLIAVVWIVGVTNSINIIDIMDGLSSSQVMVAALGFLLIAMPSEAIYVNFGAAALVGATAGFLPWNLSKRYKIFVGDGGALSMGFLLAALSLGNEYSNVNKLGVYAPLFILAIPIYDTLFVMVMRILQKKSPFLGSNDHFALRLEKIGFSRPQIVALCALSAGSLSVFAFLATQVSLMWGIWIYLFIGGEFLILSFLIAKVKMH